ncbi:Ribosomal protein S36, mitochondrial [Phaffia rhodozyma]|uniref:Ribosomal protein S36, mitochondrial n=1 Tax=Phaffia rhodozyma TaxID=264483 RepID=A0A0F7SNZ4_PHARH|nr:Ribosomal protein S36, mitochondrial [Phaffia rhodozyma]
MRSSLRLLAQWQRTPSIKFIGNGDRWAGHSSTPKPHSQAPPALLSESPFLKSLSSSSSSSPSSSSPSSPTPKKKAASSGKFDYEDDMLSPRKFWLGSLKIEEAELEAVMSGGASQH